MHAWTLPSRLEIAVRLLWSFCLIAGAALLPAATTLGSGAASGENNEGLRFPRTLTSIDGRVLAVDSLAADHNLVVVTLKATWCPVCKTQLARLQTLLPELRKCDVSFIVLSPGRPQEVAEVARETGFPYPFVADTGLAVAAGLRLARGDQIFPCMFQVKEDLRIGWTQLGRNGAYFGDGELKDYFDCTVI